MKINPLGQAEEFLRGLLAGKRVRVGRLRKPRLVTDVEIEADSGGLDGEASWPIVRLWLDGLDYPIDTTGDVEIIE